MRSAPGFHVKMMPSTVSVMIASTVESTSMVVEPQAHRSRGRVGDVAFWISDFARRETLRDEHLDRVSYEFRGLIAEDRLHPRIDEDDPAALVDDDGRVRG